MTDQKLTVEEVAREAALENGADPGMYIRDNDDGNLVARRMSGHYTLPELLSIVEDVRRVQVAYDRQFPRCQQHDGPGHVRAPLDPACIHCGVEMPR